MSSGPQSFEDGSFILTTSSNSFANMFGTQTTPTLTPTTLKTISDCLSSQNDELYRQLEHEHQARFVPPDVDFSYVRNSNQQPQHQQLLQQQQQQSLQSQGQENVSNNFLHSASDSNDSNQLTDEEDDESTSFSTGGYSQCPGDSASNDSQETFSTKSSRRSGSNGNNNNNIIASNNNKSGSRAKTRTAVRKTRGARNDEKLPPEEETRRRLRRERNKQAAARCRKRRLDHTMELTKVTDGLEEEQRKLRKELHDLEREREELESRIKNHMGSAECRSHQRLPQQQPMVKSEQQPSLMSLAKSRRPSSLPLGPGFPVSSTSSSSSTSSPAVTSCSTSLPDPLIPIQTPSNGLFVGLCGLTPLLDTPSAGGFMPTVSCGGQTRGLSSFVSSEAMVTSPDGAAPPKLVSL